MAIEEIMGNFPAEFSYGKDQYSISAGPFGDRKDENWWQIHVNQMRKRPFGRVSNRSVARITLKESGDGFHLMGNYNLSGKGSDRVPGIVGEAIQQVVESTGLSLAVDGLTDQGVQLYERLFHEHRETINVMRLDYGVYRISPRLNKLDL